MNTRGINLLTTEKFDSGHKAALEKFKKGLITAVFLYVFLTVAIFTTSLVLIFQENKIKSEVAGAEAKINSFQKTESIQIALKNRVSTVSNLLSGQSDFSKTLQKIQKLLPEGTVINLATIANDSITFEITIPTIEQLYGFLLTAKQSKADFTELTVGPVVRESSGSYTVIFSGKLAKI